MKTKENRQLRWSWVAIALGVLVATIWWHREPPQAGNGPPIQESTSAALVQNDSVGTREQVMNVNLSSMPSSSRREVGTEPSAPAPGGGSPWNVFKKAAEAPVWTVRYGKEFWQEARPAVGPGHNARADANQPSDMNLGKIIGRVSHAISFDESDGIPRVYDATYTVAFDGQGLRFSPHEPVQDASWLRTYRSRPGAQSHPDSAGADPDTEFQFQTRLVRQGNDTLYQSGQRASDWSLIGNTAQAMLNQEAGLVEHYAASSEGVEVTWILSRQPPGSGPLHIEVEVAGLDYAGKTEGGLHFADAQGVARVRVGKVTAVDANQRRTELAVNMDGQRMVVEVPEQLLAQATYPLAIDPTIGPEFGMDTPVLSSHEGTQSDPAICWDGEQYLLVWADYGFKYPGGSFIFGARVDADMNVIDEVGFQISPTAVYLSFAPSVVFDGQNFLVVWMGTLSSWNYKDGVFAARIDRNGVVLDPNAIQVSSGLSHDNRAPSVVWNGQLSFIVWADSRNDVSGSTTYDSMDYDIYGARILLNGTVLDPDGIEVSRADNMQDVPSVVWNGQDFFVAWADMRSEPSLNYNRAALDIYGTRVTSEGMVLDPEGIPICTESSEQNFPKIAWGTGSHLVVWIDESDSGGGHVYGARVDINGAVIDSEAIPICTMARWQTGPAVAFGEDSFLVAWRHIISGLDDYIYGVRVSGEGFVLGTPQPLTSAPWGQQSPRLLWRGDRYLLAWHRTGTGTGYGWYDVYATQLFNDGAGLSKSADYLISQGYNHETAPCVGYDGENYLVAWEDSRGGLSDIYGVRVSSAGEVLDPSGIVICASRGEARNPAVAWGNACYLVVWESDYGRRREAARVNGEGLVLDPGGLLLGQDIEGFSLPLVNWNGSHFLVVWDNRFIIPSQTTCILASRIDEQGSVYSANTICADRYAGTFLTGLASIPGVGWMTVWSEMTSSTGYDIFGARINANGIGLDPSGIPICTAVGDQLRPTIASDGTSYVVLWNNRVNYPSVDGVQLSANGVPLASEFTISRCHINAYPRVHCDSQRYFAVWRDYDYRVWGAGIQVGDSEPAVESFAITPEPQSPALYNAYWVGGAGKLVAYEKWDADLQVPRVVGRMVSLENIRPVADAGADQAVQYVGTTVLLDGTQSYDEDGETIFFDWTFDAKPAGSLAVLAGADTGTPSFLADVYGDYVIRLTVTDGCGAVSEPDTVKVSFTNLKPVANAGGNQAALAGDTVYLSGGASYDPNGDPLAYAWEFETIPDNSQADLSAPSEAQTTFVADLPGIYTVSLKVSDGILASESATVMITVVTRQDAAGEKLMKLIRRINALPAESLKNDELRHALTSKASAALGMLQNGSYVAVLNKLENDLLPKTDGCAVQGAPDANDWIRDCEAQAQLYPLMLETMGLLRPLL